MNSNANNSDVLAKKDFTEFMYMKKVELRSVSSDCFGAEVRVGDTGCWCSAWGPFIESKDENV